MRKTILLLASMTLFSISSHADSAFPKSCLATVEFSDRSTAEIKQRIADFDKAVKRNDSSVRIVSKTGGTLPIVFSPASSELAEAEIGQLNYLSTSSEVKWDKDPIHGDTAHLPYVEVNYKISSMAQLDLLDYLVSAYFKRRPELSGISKNERDPRTLTIDQNCIK